MSKKTRKSHNISVNDKVLKDFHKLMSISDEEEKLQHNPGYLNIKQNKQSYKKTTKIEIFQTVQQASFHDEAEYWSREIIGGNPNEMLSILFLCNNLPPSISKWSDSDLTTNTFYIKIKSECDLYDYRSKYDFVHFLDQKYCQKERSFWWNQIPKEVLKLLITSEYISPEKRWSNIDDGLLSRDIFHQKLNNEYQLENSMKLEIAKYLMGIQRYEEALFWLNTLKIGPLDHLDGTIVEILARKMACYFALEDQNFFVEYADLTIEAQKKFLGLNSIFYSEFEFLQYTDFPYHKPFHQEYVEALMKLRRYQDAFDWYEQGLEFLNSFTSPYQDNIISLAQMHNLLQSALKAKDSTLVTRALGQFPCEVLTSKSPQDMQIKLKKLNPTRNDNDDTLIRKYNMFRIFGEYCIMRAENLDLFNDKVRAQDWLKQGTEITGVFAHFRKPNQVKFMFFPLITYLAFGLYQSNPVAFKEFTLQWIDGSIIIAIHRFIHDHHKRTLVFNFYKENWSRLKERDKRSITFLRNSYLINDHFKINFAQ